MTDVEYADWARTATRPFTQPPIGYSTATRRQRCAVLSKLWTPERSLRMFQKPARNRDLETIEG
jgi:hypothetical protein